MATYPFVKSSVDLGRASGPRRAMAWHMAEGGGTVGYLSRPNPNGVSVHFVVEYSGRIVQMLDLSHMHTSLRVTAIRQSDDPPYDWKGTPVTYGATAAEGVLHDWHRNPNNASIGVEVEGFAKAGPNVAQTTAIGKLWLDMAGRYPGIRSLGHRDFADYKACPGKLFPWDRVGGHGPKTTGDDVSIDVKPDGVIHAYIIRVKAKTVTYGPDEGQRGEIGPRADGTPWVGNGLGLYVITGIGKRAFSLPDRSFVLEDAVTAGAVTATKWERSAAQPAPDPTPQKYAVTVGGKPVGEVVLP